jgi:uncharacterized protein (TIGR03663 family)
MKQVANGQMAMANTEPAVPQSRIVHPPFVLTVERAAYLAVGLLAAALRFYRLGLRPLSEGEAVQALAAFRFTHGMAGAVPAGTIPALFTGNVIGFSLMGGGDASARWLPALAGLALALLPYGLRHRLGRGGALAASLLLALSPSALYFSRDLDGAVLVAACGLALVVGLIQTIDRHQPAYVVFAAGALGLGLCAGPGIYSLLLTLVLYGLLLYLAERLLHRRLGWSSLVVAWSAARDEKGLLARAGVTLAATFGLVATAFVLHPAGLGQAADLIGAWAGGFLPEAGGEPFVYPLLLLIRYEPLILLLAVIEGGRLLRRGVPRKGKGGAVPRRREGVASRRLDPDWVAQPGSTFRHTPFLVFWAAVAALLVMVAGHRPAGNVLLVVAPLALLAGQGAERTWRWLSERELWKGAAQASAVLLGLLVFVYLQVAAYSEASPSSTVMVGDIALYTTSTYLILASVGLVLLIGAVAVVWLWRGPELAVAGGWLAAVVALELFGLQAAWGVSEAHAADPRELMIVQTTSPDVRALVQATETLSLDKAGDAHTLHLTVDAATGPVVAWYLRDFRNQTVVEGLSAPPDTVAAVTLAVDNPPIGETFRGRGFNLRWHSLPWDLWGQTWFRWLMFTEGTQPVVDQQVVLWVAGQP